MDSSLIVGEPFGWFDHVSLSWKMCQQSLLDDPALMSSQMQWPETVMSSDGFVFERQISVPVIVVSGGSALLLTPTKGDGDGGGRSTPGTRGIDKDGSGGLREQVRELLPTPRTQNGNNRNNRNNRPYLRPLDQPQNLENAIGRLTLTGDSTNGPSADMRLF